MARNKSTQISERIVLLSKYCEAISRSMAFGDDGKPDERFVDILIDAHDELLNDQLIMIAYGRYESELRRGGKTAPARAALIAPKQKGEA